MTKRVLVVDDERATTAVLAEVFGTFTHGCVYETTVAQSADDASVMLRKGFTFDLILLDVHMPVPYWRDGLGLLRHIRDLGLNVPVIMMCGMPTQAESYAAESAGASAWLIKPFKISELEHLVAVTDVERISLGELIHQHVRVAIETAVREELRKIDGWRKIAAVLNQRLAAA